MKVLLTGARGFLGSWVLRALREAGHELRVLLRARPDPGIALPPGGIESVEGDLLDPGSLDRATRGIDAIVHVAGLVSLRPRDGLRLEQINVHATGQLLELARSRRLRMVLTSSIGTLGYDSTPVVRDERSFMPAGQAAEFRYLGSKLRAERLALESVRAGGDVVILSPGVLLGPHDRYLTSVRPVLFHLRGLQRFCLTGGIGFADVRDVAAVFPRALESAERGRRFPLAGANLTYAELFVRLSAITGLPAASAVPHWMVRPWGYWSALAGNLFAHPLEEVHPVSLKYGSLYNFVESATAVRELGFRPRSFRTTLVDTIADLLARGVAPASTPALGALRPPAHSSTPTHALP